MDKTGFTWTTAVVLAFSLLVIPQFVFAQSTDDAPPSAPLSVPQDLPAVQAAVVQSQTAKLPVMEAARGQNWSNAHATDIKALEAALSGIDRQRRQGWQANAKPWENESDFLARLDNEEKRAIETLAAKIYRIGNPDVKVSIGEYDRDAKFWPITVESSDPNLIFRTSYRYSILSSQDRGSSFMKFDEFVKAGLLSGQAEYSVQRVAPSTYSLNITSVSIVHRETGEILATDKTPKMNFMYYTDSSGVRLVDGLDSRQNARDQWQSFLVEGGSFSMGSTSGSEDQKPVRLVSVASFHIGRYEVTVGEFRAFVESTSYQTQAQVLGGGFRWTGKEWKRDPSLTWLSPGFQQSDRDPVVVVSWNDAAAYCNWLSWKEGLQPAYRESGENYVLDWTRNGYRLPTEAEWEFAARGGRATRGALYSGSMDPRIAAWYYATAAGVTHPAGTKAPNELGLYDMSGNVWEWCQDWYGPYQSSERSDPKGAVSGTHRVLRGGSYASEESACRPTYRGAFAPSLSLPYVGFRVVKPAR